MRDFDPQRIASLWHSGQGSALYAYSSTDRIPTDEFKDRLVWEIEKSMAHADDDGLDELEYLLMHVEEQHPDRYPDSGMHEAWGRVDPGTGEEVWSDDDDADIRDLYLSPEAFEDGAGGDICRVCGSVGCDCITAKPSAKKEEAVYCEVCGGEKGLCECQMNEVEPRVMRQESSLRSAVLRIVKEALDDADDGDKCPECGGPPGKHDSKCPNDDSNMDESAIAMIKDAIGAVVKEMKLGIASRGVFDPSQKDDPEDDFVANFLLSKKDKDKEAEKKAPDDEKSGTKLKTTRKRSKSSQFR